MKLKALSSAVLFACLPASTVFAAALDRSGQSISAFLQPGNYFEAGISVLDADVSGTMKEGWVPPNANIQGKGMGGSDLSDMAESYHFFNAALKVQMTDNLSFGLIYDQPFGAKASYSANDKSFSETGTGQAALKDAGTFYKGGEGTSVDVQTQNLSFIFGYQPTENWNIYAGPVYQTVKGDVQLRGAAYGPFGGVLCPVMCSAMATGANKTPFKGYDASIGEDSAVGWLGGVAFQIPEIALKASLTYRSEIDHKVTVDETLGYVTNALVAGQFPTLGQANITKINNDEGKTKITTPQSVNLDFQTGIMANTVAFAQLRWVDWSEFAIRPCKFGQLASGLSQALAGTPRGFDLVAYEKDQISANVGIGRKFNDQWAGTVMVGWDSGAGNPVSTLGPTEGYWSLGLGGQFSPTPQSFIQAGVKYFWLGDAKSQVASDFGTDTYAAEFKDNDAIGYSLKIGYRF
ncbi:OmpP1/FadL family transporter [Acinetobacter chinensis]|uniref:OmpP1/FadL family transporter n=1 Tax=Acinetobacter chinensis TaxID=2004650 RepID=UPI0029341034|nr:outer membrane protein transport protein [Acinetobacter chinensis]WOE40917.1 outer membrane protein transport protein [Acinetobacter chinensis]